MAGSGRARIAVIGAGWWACETYIPALLERPDAELVAISRLEPDAMEAIRTRFGIPAGFTDHRDLLAQEKPDGVIVASPHVAHYEQASAAVAAGAHVLVDKPMTTSAPDARSLVAAAEEAGVEIVIPYGWNFKDFTRAAAELMADGRRLWLGPARSRPRPSLPSCRRGAR
jgi:predicted dehydrogenase